MQTGSSYLKYETRPRHAQRIHIKPTHMTTHTHTHAHSHTHALADMLAMRGGQGKLGESLKPISMEPFDFWPPAS